MEGAEGGSGLGRRRRVQRECSSGARSSHVVDLDSLALELRLHALYGLKLALVALAKAL